MKKDGRALVCRLKLKPFSMEWKTWPVLLQLTFCLYLQVLHPAVSAYQPYQTTCNFSVTLGCPSPWISLIVFHCSGFYFLSSFTWWTSSYNLRIIASGSLGGLPLGKTMPIPLHLLHFSYATFREVNTLCCKFLSVCLPYQPRICYLFFVISFFALFLTRAW